MKRFAIKEPVELSEEKEECMYPEMLRAWEILRKDPDAIQAITMHCSLWVRRHGLRLKPY